MKVIEFGLESTLENGEPSIKWLSSQELCEEVIRLMANALVAEAKNREMLVRRVFRFEDGSVQVEAGQPALHVQWRRARFRAEDREAHLDLTQVALVDVISGSVIIVDNACPFEAAQYEEWPHKQSLIEYIADGPERQRFRPNVRPAQAGQRCHYVILNPADCPTLKAQSRCDDHLDGIDWPYPYKVPTFD